MREVTKALPDLMARWEVAEQKLAAANALLEDTTDEALQARIEYWRDACQVAEALLSRVVGRLPGREMALGDEIRAHLAGRPAAPSRTDAELAVLDAMRAVPEAMLRRHVAEATTCDLPEPCAAELARRGLRGH